MTINRQAALRLWEERFKNRMAVKDLFGLPMKKDAFNQRGADGAWNIHHIVPKCEGGTDNDVNLIIISMDAHDQIGDRFPSYTVNSKVYDVRKIQGTQTYKIVRREQVQQEPQKQSRWAKKREIWEEARNVHGLDFDTRDYDD